MKLNLTKKISCSVLCAVMFIAAIASPINSQIAYAQSTNLKVTENADYLKIENIYARLTSTGEATDAYVVNSYEVSKSGSITDYGDYSAVTNLTNTSDITNNSGEIIFNTEKGQFFYQGEIKDVVLPWNFEVNYKLDGVSVPANELAGKSGDMEMNIFVKRNKELNADFFENFVLQISVTLPDGSLSVVAPDATIAYVGATKKISFTVLPNTEERYTLSAKVSDFEMGDISIAAVPYSMSIDMEEMGITDMTDGFDDLVTATNELADGAWNIADGIDSLNKNGDSLLSGYNSLIYGINSIVNGQDEIVDGSSAVLKALSDISAGFSNADLSGLSSLNELPVTLQQFSDSLKSVRGGLVMLQENYSVAYATLDSTMATATNSVLSEEEIEALNTYMASADATAQSSYAKLMQNYQTLLIIKGTYDQIKPVFEAVNVQLQTEGETLVKGLNDIIGGLDQMITTFDTSEDTDITTQLNELKSGLSQLAGNYQIFHDGLVTYTDGVSNYQSGVSTYKSGLNDYLDGVDDIASGVNEYVKGMDEYSAEVSKIPEEIQSEIDKMTEQFNSADYNATSFVDKKMEESSLYNLSLQ